MTLLRYLDVMSCWKKGLGSPRGPTIWTDAASVANPASGWYISHRMHRTNHTMQSGAHRKITMSLLRLREAHRRPSCCPARPEPCPPQSTVRLRSTATVFSTHRIRPSTRRA